MPDTPHAWLSPQAVVEWLQLDAADTETAALVEQVRLAAAAWCAKQRADLFTTDADTGAVGLVDDLGGDVQLAGLMYAARLWSRRSSPAGLANFAEFGAAEVLRYDPDIDRLLGIGRHASPVIG